MPNIQSAVKSMHKAAKFREKNRVVRKGIHNLQLDVYEMPADAEKEKKMTMFRRYVSALDKAAKKGVIKKNTADRRKARAAAKLGLTKK